MKRHLHLILPMLIGSTLGSHGAVIDLANYTFTHPSGSLPAGWNSNVAGALHVTASNVGIVGATFANNTTDMLRFTDTATTSFTTGANYLQFQLTADAGYYFDLTDVQSTLSFTIDRVSGDNQEARMQIFAGTDATGTLLQTSSTGLSTGAAVTVTDIGTIAAINSANQYDELFVQLQWRSTATTPASSAWTFDNFKIAGNVVAIPEPTTWSALLSGVGLLALVRRRR